MYPNIDFDPQYYFSSKDEAFSLPQTLVLQLNNFGTEPIKLSHETQVDPKDFKPLAKAEPIPGLTMLYLVFSLGTEPECFVTEEQFSQITFTLPDQLCFQKVGSDTIVIYPAATMFLEGMDMIEILMQNVISQGETDKMILIELAYFDEDTKVSMGFRPLYRKRPPLSISCFSLEKECQCSGFRDQLTFSYLANGTDKILLTPGDFTLTQKHDGEKLPQFHTQLYRSTVYSINACCGENMVSSTAVECRANEASIDAFTGTYTENKDGTRNVTLKISVKNTRHVYINRVGRIEVPPEGTIIKELKNQPRSVKYELRVENENGLIKQAVQWE